MVNHVCKQPQINCFFGEVDKGGMLERDVCWKSFFNFVTIAGKGWKPFLQARKGINFKDPRPK